MVTPGAAHFAVITLRILNKRSGVGGFGGPENDALCRIGEGAVPALIRDLDESTICAHGFEPVHYGYVIVAEPAHGAARETDRFDRAEDDGNLDREDEKRQIDVTRARVVWVLGEIGDPQSLPALQGLLSATKNETLVSKLYEAITKIKRTAVPVVNNMRRSKQIPRPPR